MHNEHDERATKNPGPLIHLRGINKLFETEDVRTHALADTTFDIERGEYVSISGPSGCGKSTLLSILGLLDSPSGGTYLLNGQSVADMRSAARVRTRNREIGFIFQAFNLIPDLTVRENVALPLQYRATLSRSDLDAHVHEALTRVGMAHRTGHFPAQLSGGQQQRVAVARALAGKPSILLADEPTGNLDSRNGEMVMTLLDELHAAGATICMVTHDMRYADLAQRKICMYDGRIVDEAVLASLRDQEYVRHAQPLEAT